MNSHEQNLRNRCGPCQVEAFLPSNFVSIVRRECKIGTKVLLIVNPQTFRDTVSSSTFQIPGQHNNFLIVRSLVCPVNEKFPSSPDHIAFTKGNSCPAELNLRDKANFDQKTHYRFIEEGLTDNGSFGRNVDLLSIDLFCDMPLFNGRF